MSESNDETPSHLHPAWTLLSQQFDEQIARLKRKREDEILAPTKQAKTERTPNRSYEATKLQQALKGLCDGTYANPNAAAKAVGIPPSTVRANYKQMLAIRAEPSEYKPQPVGAPSTLTRTEEARLVQYIADCQAADAPISLHEVKEAALQILRARDRQATFDTDDGLPSDAWWKGLKRRNPDLARRLPNQASAGHLRAETKETITECMEKFKAAKGSISDENTWTMDEFFLKAGKGGANPKVIVLRSRAAVRRLLSSAGSRHVSVINCCSAAGVALPSGLLLTGKENFTLDNLGPHSVILGRTSSGWMNGKSILAWARWFRDQVKPTKEKPVMLVLDQHSSRFNLDFIEFCRENYIKIFLLAPNLTHLISPLDRAPHRRLRALTNKSIAKRLTQLRDVTQRDVLLLMDEVFARGLTREVILNGWRKAGLAPFSIEAVLEEVKERKQVAIEAKIEREQRQAANIKAMLQERAKVQKPRTVPLPVPTQTSSSSNAMDSKSDSKTAASVRAENVGSNAQAGSSQDSSDVANLDSVAAAPRGRRGGRGRGRGGRGRGRGRGRGGSQRGRGRGRGRARGRGRGAASRSNGASEETVSRAVGSGVMAPARAMPPDGNDAPNATPIETIDFTRPAGAATATPASTSASVAVSLQLNTAKATPSAAQEMGLGGLPGSASSQGPMSSKSSTFAFSAQSDSARMDISGPSSSSSNSSVNSAASITTAGPSLSAPSGQASVSAPAISAPGIASSDHSVTDHWANLLPVPQLRPAPKRKYKRPQFPTGGDLTADESYARIVTYEKEKAASENGDSKGAAGSRRGDNDDADDEDDEFEIIEEDDDEAAELQLAEELAAADEEELQEAKARKHNKDKESKDEKEVKGSSSLGICATCWEPVGLENSVQCNDCAHFFHASVCSGDRDRARGHASAGAAFICGICQAKRRKG